MKKHIWHSGPPPSIGWWPASIAWNPEILRWWDGKNWSEPARTDFSPQKAAKQAEKREKMYESLKWCERWWE